MNRSLLPDAPPPVPFRRSGSGPRIPGVALIFIAAIFLVAIAPMWVWFFCRIEPGPGEIAILIHKTGKDLPSGQILAEPDQKGIQLDVLSEGRYFRNPYSWGWQIWRITDIPAGQLGVQTRLFGKDLPPGEIIASEGTKGIVADVLRPGKYRINPYAYNVELFDAINVRPGYVGVVTSLVGHGHPEQRRAGGRAQQVPRAEGHEGRPAGGAGSRARII